MGHNKRHPARIKSRSPFAAALFNKLFKPRRVPSAKVYNRKKEKLDDRDGNRDK